MFNTDIDNLFDGWIESNRLPHSVLMHGDNIHSLNECVQRLAQQLLGNDFSKVTSHPDYFILRPANKMRRISVDSVRELIQKINQSPNHGERKVVVVYEADRMYAAASNAFLKTLEEPPLDTTIFLLTTYPNRLLPTIRSRCFSLFVPGGVDKIEDEGWSLWVEDYSQWLSGMLLAQSSVDESIMGVYGLVARFGTILQGLSKALWKVQRDGVTEHMTVEEMAALEVSFYKELRGQLFAEIGLVTRECVLGNGGEGVNEVIAERSLKFGRAIDKLERSVGLLEVNLNETAALEYFLLESVRIWYQRKKAC